MGKTFTYILSALVLLGAMFALGWWLGSCKEPVEVVREKERYIFRPAINIGIKDPAPTKIESINLPFIVFANETIHDTIPADTASIVADYLKRREYDLDFSTDTTGIYKLQAVIECNRLKSASATIIPLQREIERTVVKVRKFRPFVSGGVAMSDKIGVSLGVGGIIKEKHIVSAKYTRYGKQNIYGAEYGYIIGK